MYNNMLHVSKYVYAVYTLRIPLASTKYSIHAYTLRTGMNKEDTGYRIMCIEYNRGIHSTKVHIWNKQYSRL